ncbi:MAG: EamA family transporter [Pseudomonadota bacterium]
MIANKQTVSNLIGLSALIMWSSLAVLSVMVRDIPPFQLLSIGMFLGGLSGALTWPFRKGAWRRALLLPAHFWAIGIYGLFFYHLCFFLAMRWAPPLQANVINYLWPLFMIVMAALFLPNGKLRGYHIVGTLIGLAGVGVTLAAEPHAPGTNYFIGYLCAAGAALGWSSYTVLCRSFKGISTDAVTGFCFATALLALLVHLSFEQTVWPASTESWIAMFMLGLFPTGIAFYAWDVGIKHGNLILLGLVSYATRIASSIFLWAFGYAEFTTGAVVGIALVTIGAAIASRELFIRKKKSELPAEP